VSRRAGVSRVLVGAALVLGVALAYQAVGAAVFLPRLASTDPREVVTAYFEARAWGYAGISEAALAPDQRDLRHARNYVQPLVPDELFARDLEVSAPADISLYGQHDEERQFTVAYRSRWRSTIGEPPGTRHWFVYVGRDEGGRWLLLGQGTGP
jgi:hypothetical protein